MLLFAFSLLFLSCSAYFDSIVVEPVPKGSYSSLFSMKPTDSPFASLLGTKHNFTCNVLGGKSVCSGVLQKRISVPMDKLYSLQYSLKPNFREEILIANFRRQVDDIKSPWRHFDSGRNKVVTDSLKKFLSIYFDGNQRSERKLNDTAEFLQVLTKVDLPRYPIDKVIGNNSYNPCEMERTSEIHVLATGEAEAIFSMQRFLQRLGFQCGEETSYSYPSYYSYSYSYYSYGSQSGYADPSYASYEKKKKAEKKRKASSAASAAEPEESSLNCTSDTYTDQWIDFDIKSLGVNGKITIDVSMMDSRDNIFHYNAKTGSVIMSGGAVMDHKRQYAKNDQFVWDSRGWDCWSLDMMQPFYFNKPN